MINITYYGHSCFKVNNEKHSVLFDPYEDGSVPGITLPKDLNVDYVYCSHQHHDHNARELVNENNLEPFPNKTIVVSHDDANGTLRGMNDIHIIHVENMQIVHFGDIGRPLTNEEQQQLTCSDVIMIPVGGYYTIDAIQAKQIVSQLKPKLTILMHYRKGCIGYDVLSSIDEIKKVFYDIEECSSKIAFDSNSIPEKTIIMDIMQ